MPALLTIPLGQLGHIYRLMADVVAPFLQRIRSPRRTIISAGVEHHAKDAVVLIHEATNTALMHLIADELDANSSVISGARIKCIVNVHSDTLALAELAQKINVKHLLLNHLIPALPTSFVTDRYFTSGMDENFDGEISVAFDGWWFYPSK